MASPLPQLGLWRLHLPTLKQFMSEPASLTFAPLFPSATVSTSPWMAAEVGSISAWKKRDISAELSSILRMRLPSTSEYWDMCTNRTSNVASTNPRDGGSHWTKILDQGSQIGVSDLAICSAHPQLLFAGTWNTWRPPWSTYAPIDRPGGSLYRSRDSGATWSKLSGSGLPEGDWGRVGVDVTPDGKRVYALIQAKKSGLYRSDDGGDTWTLANDDPRLTSRAWYFNSVTIDPSNPDVLYMPNVALYRSEDGGKTISIVRGAPWRG